VNSEYTYHGLVDLLMNSIPTYQPSLIQLTNQCTIDLPSLFTFNDTIIYMQSCFVYEVLLLFQILSSGFLSPTHTSP